MLKVTPQEDGPAPAGDDPTSARALGAANRPITPRGPSILPGRRIGVLSFLAVTALALTGCKDGGEPLATVDYVDLDRFMGDWYVVAGIVTPLEQDAYNPVESYERVGPEKVQTTFTFREGGFDGPKKTLEPKGFIRDTESNAEWGMQFFWPFKADYRIIYLDEDYDVTVIGRKKRDFVWIMARQPSIPDDQYREIIDLLDEVGYDTGEIRQMPQRWDDVAT